MSSSSPRENVVFVGGISRKVDEACLRNFFSTFGTVTECKIIVDHLTGKSKGYGFVVFADRQAADTVKKAPQEDLFLLGKSMNVGDAYRKSDAAVAQGQDAGAFATSGASMAGLAGRPQQRRFGGPGGAGSPLFYDQHQQQQFFAYPPAPYYASAGFYPPQYYSPSPAGWQGYQFPYGAPVSDAAAASQAGPGAAGASPAATASAVGGVAGAAGGAAALTPEEMAAGFARMQLGARAGGTAGAPLMGAGPMAPGGYRFPYAPQPQQQPQPQMQQAMYARGGGRPSFAQHVSPAQAMPPQASTTAPMAAATAAPAEAATAEQ